MVRVSDCPTDARMAEESLAGPLTRDTLIGTKELVEQQAVPPVMHAVVLSESASERVICE